jgi:uncharacterized protein (DUF2147 family)
MKRTLIAALLALAPAALAADPVHGMWQTEVDDGAYAHVELSGCNAGKTCGWIRRTFNDTGEYQSENLNKVLVIDMVNVGGGEYEGKVWRPSNNKTYVGKMQLNGGTFHLEGCILGGLACGAKQTWTRIQ